MAFHAVAARSVVADAVRSGSLSDPASPLWKLTVELMRDALGPCAEPWGRDGPRVRQVMWELYLLGERMTPAAVAEVGGVGGDPTTWSRTVARLWRERLGHPYRNIRGAHKWRTPFRIPEDVVELHGLESITSRLRREASRAVDELVAADMGDRAARDQDLRMAVWALRLWMQAQAALRTPDGEVLFSFRLRPEYRLASPYAPDRT